MRRYLKGSILAIMTGISNPVIQFLGAIVPIYIVAFIRGILIMLIAKGSMTLKSRTKPSKRIIKLYVLLGVLATMGFFTYYPVLNIVEIGIVALFTVNLTMILTIVLSVVILKDKVTITQVVLIVLGLTTLFLVTYEAVKVEWSVGYLLLFLNSVINSFCAIVVKKIIDERDASEIAYFRTSIDVMTSLFVIVYTPELVRLFIEKAEVFMIPVLIYLGVNSYILSILSIKSTREIGVIMTDVLRSTSSIFTILIGVFFLGDNYSIFQYVCLTIFICTIVGIVYINSKMRNTITPSLAK